MGIISCEQKEIVLNQGYYKEIQPANQSSPVSFQQMEIIMEQMKKNICKIYLKDGNFGTGFFCEIPFPDEFNILPVLFTNNHVLKQKDIEIDNIITFTLDNDKIDKKIIINSKRKTYTSKELDTTIIEIKKKDEIKSFLDIDEKLLELSSEELKEYCKGKDIYVIQYPKGFKSSFHSGIIKGINKNVIHHFCATEKGSSGSPIISLWNFKVLGIHKGYNNINNLGTLITVPIKEFINKFKNNKIKLNDIEDKINKTKFSQNKDQIIKVNYTKNIVALKRDGDVKQKEKKISNEEKSLQEEKKKYFQ